MREHHKQVNQSRLGNNHYWETSSKPPNYLLLIMSLFSQAMTLLSGPGASEGSQIAAASTSARIQAIYPLSRSQEGIWTEYTMTPSSTKYNLTMQWDLTPQHHGQTSSSIPTIMSSDYPRLGCSKNALTVYSHRNTDVPSRHSALIYDMGGRKSKCR